MKREFSEDPRRAELKFFQDGLLTVRIKLWYYP
jgi:hypothetical protein